MTISTRGPGLSRDALDRTLDVATRDGFLRATDAQAVLYLFDGQFPFGEACALASSVHVHTKVGDVADLDHGLLARGGGTLERQSEGYVKYRFAGGVNLIFSSFPISEEDLLEALPPERLPYIDHLGVDMRDASEHAVAVHAGIPELAILNGWDHRYQGAPVYGCHAEVKEKHWVYPPGGPSDWRRPTEFPLGPLTVHEDYMGCDLRPIHPRHPLAGMVSQYVASACDGTTSCGGPAAPCDAAPPGRTERTNHVGPQRPAPTGSTP